MNSPVQGNPNEMSVRLEFTKNLNHVTNKIHATSNIDEIMLDVSKDICGLFNADRLSKFPMEGEVVANPMWRNFATGAALLSVILMAAIMGFFISYMRSTTMPPSSRCGWSSSLPMNRSMK